MSQRTRILLLWVGIASGIAIIFGSTYLFLTADSVTTEYRSRAELLSWVFADQVSFELNRGDMSELDLLSGPLAFGNVLYAQVLRESDVIAGKSLLEESLPPTQFPSGIWEIERITIDNKSLWDIRRGIASSNSTFIRMGLSLAPIQSTIRLQVLLVLGFGLAFVALVALAATFLTRRATDASIDTHSTVFGDATLSGAKSMMSQDSGSSFSTAPVGDSGNGIEQTTHEPLATNQSPKVNNVITVGELMIDDGSKRVELSGEEIELSPKEFDLLFLLAQEPGKVYSNKDILDHVWSDSHMATAQDVKQYIYFVRQKLEEDPKKPNFIVTVRGFGYKLQA
jgi:DNA-binding response OmpR family regulator